MERTRLKLAVIFLLAALNVVLLGYVLLQAQQSRAYEDLTRQQIMTYLTDHGIAVSETHIPWDEDWRAVVLEEESNNMGGDPLPEGGLPENCEVETARSAVTLLMELAVGLSDLGVSSATIQSIETGYRYAGEGGPGRPHPHVETGNFWTELLPELRDGGSDPPHRVRRNLL